MSTPPVLTQGEKHALLREYFDAHPYPVVIETGIWQGQGSCFQFYDRAVGFAIESSAESCSLAPWPVICGDSEIELPKLLAEIPSPAFFWLDAHLVSEADEPNHSPLLAELEAILNWPHAVASTLLIDDVRMMGREGWPSLADVEKAVHGDAIWQYVVKDDIVRLTPW